MSQPTPGPLSTSADVVDYLKAQHQQIKALFARTLSAAGDHRDEAFVELRRLLAVHETAEEEVVHPRARQALADGEQVVDARLQEENEAKQALAELEKLEVDSPEFSAGLEQLRADVVEHAEAEEQHEFAGLREALDDDGLERMRRAVEFAESTAPTHPHPGVETPGKNMLVGPFAAMIDRAKDAISGKK